MGLKRSHVEAATIPALPGHDGGELRKAPATDAAETGHTLTAPAAKTPERPRCPCFVGPFLPARGIPSGCSSWKRDFSSSATCCAHVHLTRDAQPRIVPISYPRRATQTLKRTEIVGQCRNSFGPDDEGNPAGTPGPRCFDHFGMEFVEFSPPALGCPRRV